MTHVTVCAITELEKLILDRITFEYCLAELSKLTSIDSCSPLKQLSPMRHGVEIGTEVDIPVIVLIAFSLIPSLHPEISESRRSFNYSSLEIYIFGDQTINHTSKTFSRQISSLFNLSSVSKNNSFITDRCLDSGALCRWHFNGHFTYLSDLCSVRSELKKKYKQSSRSPGGAEHIQLPCLFSSILALLA